jgi:hypothetical protein
MEQLASSSSPTSLPNGPVVVVVRDIKFHFMGNSLTLLNRAGRYGRGHARLWKYVNSSLFVTGKARSWPRRTARAASHVISEPVPIVDERCDGYANRPLVDHRVHQFDPEQRVPPNGGQKYVGFTHGSVIVSPFEESCSVGSRFGRNARFRSTTFISWETPSLDFVTRTPVPLKIVAPMFAFFCRGRPRWRQLPWESRYARANDLRQQAAQFGFVQYSRDGVPGDSQVLCNCAVGLTRSGFYDDRRLKPVRLDRLALFPAHGGAFFPRC